MWLEALSAGYNIIQSGTCSFSHESCSDTCRRSPANYRFIGAKKIFKRRQSMRSTLDVNEQASTWS